MFERLWVPILVPYTGWIFFALIYCKNCIVCLKRPKNNEKEAGVGPFKKIKFVYDIGPLRGRDWRAFRKSTQQIIK